eukprot:114896_1
MVIMNGVDIINAQNILGVLNVTCNGEWRNFDIICPINNDSKINCNIDCSSSNDFACYQMNVYGIYGTDDVNWNGCNNSISTACQGSILACDTDIGLDSLHSEWIWNQTIGWTYKNNDCTNISRPKSHNMWEWLEGWKLIMIIVIAFLLFILIPSLLIYYYIYWKREQLSMYINRPLVILFSIGKYMQNPREPDIEGKLKPLHGIQFDIEKMVDLFHHKLGYEIHPKNVFNKNVKIEWTKQEIKDLLEKEAKYLNNNILKYDG